MSDGSEFLLRPDQLWLTHSGDSMQKVVVRIEDLNDGYTQMMVQRLKECTTLEQLCFDAHRKRLPTLYPSNWMTDITNAAFEKNENFDIIFQGGYHVAGIIPDILKTIIENGKPIGRLDMSNIQIGHRILAGGNNMFKRVLNYVKELNLKNPARGLRLGNLVSKALAKNTSVTLLNFEGADLDTENVKTFIKNLKTNTTLSDLRIGYNCDETVDGTCIEELPELVRGNTNLTNLSVINLFKNNPTSGVDHLTSVVRATTALRSLNVNYNRFHDVDTQKLNAFVTAVEACTTLTDLDIGNNRLAVPEKIATIYRLLENTNLDRLDIAGVGERGVMLSREHNVQIANRIENNSTLISLNISSIYFDPDIIIGALCRNSSLTELDFSDNISTFTAAINYREFANVLRQNSRLTSLSMQANFLIVQDFAPALEQNTTLRILNLTSSLMESTDIHVIIDALKRNRSLQKLYLSDCNCVNAYELRLLHQCLLIDNKTLMEVNTKKTTGHLPDAEYKRYKDLAELIDQLLEERRRYSTYGVDLSAIRSASLPRGIKRPLSLAVFNLLTF